MTGLTLKDLGIRFKRYDIDHPSGPNFRAIQVTEKNLQAIFRYLEASKVDVGLEYDPTKHHLYIYQWRRWVQKTGRHVGRVRRKRVWQRVRPGDYVVQYHDASWECLNNQEFQEMLKKAETDPEFKTFKFGGDNLRAVEVTMTNGAQIISYIERNGGRATVSARKPGDIRIYQRTSGKGWSKRDWRVASPGDYVVQHTNGEFHRVLRRHIGTIEFYN